jgi:type III secretory pathway component EscU
MVQCFLNHPDMDTEHPIALDYQISIIKLSPLHRMKIQNCKISLPQMSRKVNVIWYIAELKNVPWKICILKAMLHYAHWQHWQRQKQMPAQNPRVALWHLIQLQTMSIIHVLCLILILCSYTMHDVQLTKEEEEQSQKRKKEQQLHGYAEPPSHSKNARCA